MVRGNHGRNNQAGDLAPVVSPWGQALFHGTAQLITHPAPLVRHSHAFGGTAGAIHTASAHPTPIQALKGYGGDAPQTLQGTVKAPPPWARV